jgi:cyclohexanone monooxygenase
LLSPLLLCPRQRLGRPRGAHRQAISIEQQVEWISDSIEHMRERGLTQMENSTQTQGQWVEFVRAVARLTRRPPANSGYFGANIPGKKRFFMPCVGGFMPYRDDCSETVSTGCEGFELCS